MLPSKFRCRLPPLEEQRRRWFPWRSSPREDPRAEKTRVGRKKEERERESQDERDGEKGDRGRETDILLLHRRFGRNTSFFELVLQLCRGQDKRGKKLVGSFELKEGRNEASSASSFLPLKTALLSRDYWDEEEVELTLYF